MVRAWCPLKDPSTGRRARTVAKSSQSRMKRGLDGAWLQKLAEGPVRVALLRPNENSAVLGAASRGYLENGRYSG